MKRKLIPAVLCAVSVVAGCQPATVPHATRGTPVPVGNDITLQPIADGVWVYTAYFDLPDYGRYPANGLVVIDSNDALLIDLPWTDEQTAVLFDWLAEKHGATVKTVVPTHFHEDCMGGLAEAHRRGAVSHGLDKTIAIARQRKLPVPQIPYHYRTMIHCGRTVAIVTHFGPGHTTDNVVVGLPKQRVLFGGCLIKSLDSQSLGNTKDGDLTAYPATLRKVQVAARGMKVVVPGHGDWGGPELIDHTLELCTVPSDGR